jgi:hypothetical protein
MPRDRHPEAGWPLRGAKRTPDARPLRGLLPVRSGPERRIAIRTRKIGASII